ncbi:hypothetical protein [Sphingobacterium sp. LRF_L2]|uniref:hypothetical protein n=1 Tax=Sphingobacterium sp. LRF_L2 TaxID=3369421 RepID=UPI003F60D9C1
MKKIFLKGAMCITVAGLLASCGNGANTENKDQKESAADRKLEQYVLDAKAENPSVFLSIVDTEQTDSSAVYTVKSLRDQDTIGLKLEVLKNVPPGITVDGTPDNDAGFTKGAVKFTSLGKESDSFLQALRGLYKQSGSDKMTDTTLQPLVFFSSKTEIDLTKNGTYSFKLFFGNGVGAEAEAFLVLDLYKRLVEFKSKDSTQYPRLIAAFEGK